MDTSAPEIDDGPFEVYWFYLPIGLSDGVPDTHIFETWRPGTLEEAHRLYGDAPPGDVEPLVPEVSLQIRPVPVVNQDMDRMTAVFLLASELHGDTVGEFTPPDTSDEYAVAEVMVPFTTLDDPAALDEAFTVAIETIAIVQRAMSLLTDAPVQLVTPVNTIHAVPVVVGSIGVFEDGATPPVSDRFVYVTPASRAREIGGHDAPQLDQEAIDAAVDLFDRGFPFAGMAELRREAEFQRRVNGNFGLAVLGYAMTAEVLLDTTLGLLWWEEGKDPGAAAEAWGRSVANRTRSHLLPVLDSGQGAVDVDALYATYRTHIALVRNEVVHSGYRPTGAEMEAAAEAYAELERALGTLLVMSATDGRWSRSAWFYVIIDRARDETSISDAVLEQLVHEDPQGWVDSFSRWRRDLKRWTDDAYGFRLDQADCSVVAVVGAPAITWVLHDRTSELAAVIPEPGHFVAATATTSVAEVHSGALASGKRPTVWVGAPTQEVDAHLVADLDWVPDYTLLPNEASPSFK